MDGLLGLEIETPGFKVPNPANFISWSTSRADCANECLYKYKRIYIDGVKATGRALWFGNEAHKLQAEALLGHHKDPKVILHKLDSNPKTDAELYTLVPAIAGFTRKWLDFAAKEGIVATIEQQYAIDRELKPTSFFDKKVYIRGVFDLWAYSEKSKKLIVIDHKTNKSSSSPASVKANQQLALYVWMLSLIANPDWEKAHVALNLLRHNKLVWASFTREESESFGKAYMQFLQILEDRIAEAKEKNEWKATPGFYCRYPCAFKDECPAHNPGNTPEELGESCETGESAVKTE